MNHQRAVFVSVMFLIFALATDSAAEISESKRKLIQELIGISGSASMPEQMAEQQSYLGIGGSDSHIVSHVGRCATEFSNPIHSELELVEALNAGEFKAVSFKT